MENIISFGTTNLPSTARPGKGNSIIALPTEYCMIDLETTGLSPRWNDIIEIGAIYYRNGQEVDRFQSFVQPPSCYEGLYVSSFIEQLTGISNEMLSTAPTADVVLPVLLDFVKDSTILGYNVSFDVNFLYDSCIKFLNTPFCNDYIDVRRLARKIISDLPRYRLKDMAAYFGIDNWQAHRTINDCEVTNQVYQKLCADGLERFGSEQAIIASFHALGSKHTGVKLSEIVADESKSNPDCPLYQRHCVITGKLDRFTRAQAMQLIADLGGVNDSSVTKNTNFLILGNNDYCSTIQDGKSSKQKKAEAYKLDGQDIEIIPENVFYDMIAEYVGESNSDKESGLDEGSVADHFISVIHSVCPDAKITLEHRSENYLSFCVNDIDVLRIKYTDRAKWISVDAWRFDLNENDPRFSIQNNKSQRHWKAQISGISDLDMFDDLFIAAYKLSSF